MLNYASNMDQNSQRASESAFDRGLKQSELAVRLAENEREVGFKRAANDRAERQLQHTMDSFNKSYALQEDQNKRAEAKEQRDAQADDIKYEQDRLKTLALAGVPWAQEKLRSYTDATTPKSTSMPRVTLADDASPTGTSIYFVSPDGTYQKIGPARASGSSSGFSDADVAKLLGDDEGEAQPSAQPPKATQDYSQHFKTKGIAPGYYKVNGKPYYWDGTRAVPK